MELTAADIEEDFAVIDGTETVDVLQIDADGGATLATASDVTVLRRQVDVSEQAVEGGGIQVTTCRWHLKAADMAWVPKKRDRIVDSDGGEWVIDGVTKAAFATRYICETTQYPG